MAVRPTPLALRLYRSARVSVHVIEGVLTAALVFPWLGSSRRQILIRGWSRRLLRMLKVEARGIGRASGRERV
jgi:1-acyl-sn-glycerol-3-phosphate acyltransferase